MYCSNCGKEVKDQDNFCRFCGFNLKSGDVACEEIPAENLNEDKQKYDKEEKTEEKDEFVYNGEELVLCEVKKHIMALFWTIFLTPLFIIYFWTIFLNSLSFFSWIIILGMLALIIYPVSCFKSDKFVITTKSVHVKIGVINPAEFEIPVKDFNNIEITQSSMGRIFDYGTVTFHHISGKYDYPYVKAPEELYYIFKNPEEFIKAELKKEE